MCVVSQNYINWLQKYIVNQMSMYEKVRERIKSFVSYYFLPGIYFFEMNKILRFISYVKLQFHFKLSCQNTKPCQNVNEKFFCKFCSTYVLKNEADIL